jgi:hypothetical protein
MIRTFYKSLVILLVSAALIPSLGFSQPVLPDMVAITQKGVNILSWVSQYDGVKSIAVQRSNDSVYNYTTIGYVKNLKKGPQGFIDGHPVPGVNWYRLYIVFSSDLTWYSNRAKLFVDSAQLMLQQRVLPPNDSLQKMLNNITLNAGSDPSEINAYTYIRSQYVFTNPFTGHVNVELPDSTDNRAIYSLKFFDQKNKQVVEVPKITQHSIIIDKRNFQRKGLYKFELSKNKEQLETGYITIY